MNPENALKTLLDGNERFISGVRSIEPMFSHQKMGRLSEEGQKPFAIVLTCSDSRSPVEMIFDQGIGEVFVVRVAGNVVAPSLLASIEFAAANFGSCLILVMGHTKCGAVHAAYHHTKSPNNILPSVHLEELVSRIRPAVELTLSKKSSALDAEQVELCAIENVKRSVNLILEQSSIVSSLVKQGKVKIEGAILDISTGQVGVLGLKPALPVEIQVRSFLQAN